MWRSRARLPLNSSRLRRQIRRHEGFRRHPYTDTTGHRTIAYGRNLDAIGISRLEGKVLLDNDITVATNHCHRFPWFAELKPIRQEALVNMVFNLGWTKFNTFVNMIAALEAQDYNTAAREALDSLWAIQTGSRARELAEQIRSGR